MADNGKSPITHLIHYAGPSMSGALEVALPAGWTPGNYLFVMGHLTQKYGPVYITGVTAFDAPNKPAIDPVALLDLAATLDEAVAQGAGVGVAGVARGLRDIVKDALDDVIAKAIK